MNFSTTTVIFTAYGPTGPLAYLFAFLILLIYLLTLFVNAFLALVIYTEPSLHKPMYVFLFNLTLNGLLGSSAVCPKMMDLLISGNKQSSYEGCLLQVFFITFYGSSAYAILTAMAYDRYVSICKPLQYHTIMTPTRVWQLLVGVYFFPISFISLQVFLTSQLPLCRYLLNKLFCDNLAVVNLSCVKSNFVNGYGICLIVGLVLVPLILVLISYVKILSVSLRASRDSQRKALSTCVPHLITFANFSLATLFSVIYNRFSSYIPNEVNIFMSLHFILIPPVLNPVIYGIRTRDIRRCIRKILRKSVLPGPDDIADVKQNFTAANGT